MGNNNRFLKYTSMRLEVSEKALGYAHIGAQKKFVIFILFLICFIINEI